MGYSELLIFSFEGIFLCKHQKRLPNVILEGVFCNLVDFIAFLREGVYLSGYVKAL